MLCVIHYDGDMRKVLSKTFFERNTRSISRDLLGKFLVRKKGRRTVSAMIIEVEAYDGPYDKASHASRGRTARTSVMFGPPGYWYVYLVYGMHYCLNIVTGPKDYPAAVLIRGVENISGPGRVCRYFGIDRRFSGKKANRAAAPWIEDRGVRIPKSAIGRGKRIGVEYAGRWKDKPWRFYIKKDFLRSFRF